MRAIMGVAPQPLLQYFFPLLSSFRLLCRLGRFHFQGYSSGVQSPSFVEVAQDAVVPHPPESWRKYVQAKPAEELSSFQAHGFALAILAVVLVAEGNSLLVDVSDAVVGDGHFVCVPSQVFHHSLGPMKRRFGIDNPMLGKAFAAPLSKRLLLPGRDVQATLFVSIRKMPQVYGAENFAHGLNREEEASAARPFRVLPLPLWREPSTRYNTVYVWV